MTDTNDEPGAAILAKGFRPFFLLSALMAAVWIPLWAWRYGHAWSGGWLGQYWHGHAMIYGFFGAMIAGFLLTAVENWTGKRTVTPGALLGLVLCWIAGRVFLVTGSPGIVGAVVDVAFFPLLALAVARPIVQTKNRRNYVIIAILVALSLANLCMHLSALGVVSTLVMKPALLVSTMIVASLVTLISGRVIPFFTQRAIGRETSRNMTLERVIAACLIAVILGDALSIRPLVGAASLAVGVLLVARMARWQLVAATQLPILIILHVGHLWLALGFFIRGLAMFYPKIPISIGLHLITLGGMSVIGLGMMARVSLGHTGRTIVAPPAMLLAFLSLNVAVLIRTIVPVVANVSYSQTMMAAAIAWSLAFALYVLHYTPMLFAPRPDGKPG